MKRLVTSIALSALLLVPPSQARLGETSEECHLRYRVQCTETEGQGFWSVERKYEKNGFEITIRLLPGSNNTLAANYIEYRPLDPATNRFTEASIKTLLLANVPTDWTKLTELTPPPPAPPKTAPDPAKSTFGRTSRKDIITIGAITDPAKRQAEKEARERKALLDSIDARNRDISALRTKIGKITTGGDTCWQSSNAYATCSDSFLTIFTETYMKAFDRQAKIDQARKAKIEPKPEADPLEGL